MARFYHGQFDRAFRGQQRGHIARQRKQQVDAPENGFDSQAQPRRTAMGTG
jgi:hypothetical protein